jgi:hypothetical protein
LQALLVDPNTTKDPQMKLAVQKRLAQLNASFIDPHEKNIPSPTNDNPVTTRVEEGYPAEYKGWKYDVEWLEDEDTRKKLHSATKDGKQVSIDWSPYSNMSDEDYKLWIDLGMPDREAVGSIGPIDHDDLITVAKTKQGTADLLTRELNELKRLSGLTDDKGNLTGKVDAKTQIQLQKAKQRYQGLAKGDPIASMIMSLEKQIDRLDQENDIEDAQIAAQDVVDKMHTDSINQLKKLK